MKLRPLSGSSATCLALDLLGSAALSVSSDNCLGSNLQLSVTAPGFMLTIHANFLIDGQV